MYQTESDFTSLTVFKKQLKLLYLEKQLEESIVKEDEHICNYLTDLCRAYVIVLFVRPSVCHNFFSQSMKHLNTIK
jgi:hypothetical protein